MGLASDLKILYHLALKPVRGKDHAARMESFYSGQAEAYDDFRKRLLKGRQELWNLIQPPEGGTWIDMGGATGGNIEYFGERLNKLMADHTGQPIERISRDVERDYFMGAEAAKEYGIVDQILDKRAPVAGAK